MSGNPANTTSAPEVPVILFVHRQEVNLKQQTYGNIIIVNSADGSAPEFFQAGIEKHRMDGIYGFLSEYDYLTQEDSVQVIVDTLNNPYVGAVYTDNVLVAHNSIPQIFPAFSKNTLDFSVINVPLFLSSNLLRPWDTSLNTTYFYDYFKQLGMRTLLAHIPQPLVATQWHQISAEEINKVRQKYAEG